MIKKCKHGHEIQTQEEMRSDGACKHCIALVSKKNTLFKREVKATLIEYKGGMCSDCSGIFPNCVYHFDHRDPFSKSFNVCSELNKPAKELKEEADKCDLVCANCHAIRTYGNEIIAKKISQGWENRR